MNKTLHLKANMIGNDYICGDVHGCYDVLSKKLEQICFDKNDRLFMTGDLIDRGEKSYETIKMLENKNIYSVLGNHEYMLYMLYNKYSYKDFVSYVKDDWSYLEWFLDIKKEEQEKIIHIISKMPYAIDIESDYDKIGIIHADIPLYIRNWDDLINKIIKNNPDVKEHVLWSKERFSQEKIEETKIENISYIFCGHQALEKPLQFGNMIFIDTGCGYNKNNLTVLKIKYNMDK